MKQGLSILRAVLASGLIAASNSGLAAYVSGSTGADGAFAPTASQTVQLPPDGILNYTTVDIPTGVVITYAKNAANTPVTILATGDVNIAGTIDVSATSVDVASGGIGGPGGFDGGASGQSTPLASSWVDGYTGANVGRAGGGPGGGAPGKVYKPHPYSGWPIAIGGGGGGAYGTAPPPPLAYVSTNGNTYCPPPPGAVYGNDTLVPLVGGSGGGGGTGGSILPGSGGGGGGGAILIASSGTINVTGSILANGGVPLSPGAGNGRGAWGGGGSGGAIRLIATTVSGNGKISAMGGSFTGETAWIADGVTIVNSTNGAAYVTCSKTNYTGGSNLGGAGRIRIDTEILTRTAATTPPWVRGTPSPAFVPGLPTLVIQSIGGVTVPAGNSSISLPTGFSNPVTVTFVTSGVTVGSTIELNVIPAHGLAYKVTSAATTGTTSSATSSVTINVVPGPYTLQASVTYTIVASLGNALSVYAQGERVEKISLASTLGSKESTVTLITVSGKRFVVPVAVLATMPS